MFQSPHEAHDHPKDLDIVFNPLLYVIVFRNTEQFTKQHNHLIIARDYGI